MDNGENRIDFERRSGEVGRLIVYLRIECRMLGNGGICKLLSFSRCFRRDECDGWRGNSISRNDDGPGWGGGGH